MGRGPGRKPKPGCGTYSAYVRHHQQGEAPCGACREAHREYHREYRRRRSEAALDLRTMNAARYQAFMRLKEKYPEDFRRFYRDELAKRLHSEGAGDGS